MGTLVWLWESTTIAVEGLWALAGLGIFGLLVLALTLRARLARPFAMRSLLAAEQIRTSLARAMETGEEVHVALGIGGLGDLSTADTLAGLQLVSYLAQRGALAEIPVRVRVAEPTALVGAMATMQHAALSTGYPEAYEPTHAEFVAPAPVAYGVGVAEALRPEPAVANAMVGAFGPEMLFPAEVGVERGLAQVGGTSAPSVLPLFAATMQGPLLGEEIYALGAALGRDDHTGSLAAQDLFRALMACGIVLAAILGLVRA
jgi:hypothetical protein